MCYFHDLNFFAIMFFEFLSGIDVCYPMQNINQMAHLKRTKFGQVDLDYVLGIGGFDLER